MKEVWLMRHGPQAVGENPTVWHPEAPLSDKGRELVKSVYQTHLWKEHFLLYGSSPFLRARETAAIVSNGMAVNTFSGLATISEMAWSHILQMYPWYALVGSDLRALFSLQPGLLLAEGEHTFRCIREVADELSGRYDLEQAFLVSHQPLIEMAVAVATNTFPPELSLQKGEIVIFYFEDDKFSDWKHLPLP